mgnify:CR=1 FL=1
MVVNTCTLLHLLPLLNYYNNIDIYRVDDPLAHTNPADYGTGGITGNRGSRVTSPFLACAIPSGCARTIGMGEAAEKLPEYRVGPGRPPIHTQFGAGNRANPRGIGPTGVLMLKVRQHYDDGDKLLPILDQALTSNRVSDRLTAVQIILERGWGKAPQPIAMTGDGTIPLNANGLSDTEFKQFGGKAGVRAGW